jgi:hypothetical protein
VAEKIVMKRNDLQPRLEIRLERDGVAVDLTTAVEVRFLVKRGATLKIDDTMLWDVDQSVEGGKRGIVFRDWEPGDTDTAAEYQVEYQVMWPSSRPETFPDGGYDVLQVVKDLGPA